MPKLSFNTINYLMGKEHSPIQKQFDASMLAKRVKHVKPIHNGKKPGNNDPCPCGSLKKFKHCCKS